jgi:hypothetical protein
VIAPFVTQLRTQGAAIDLSAGATDAFMIRGQVHEAWDAVRVLVSAGTTVHAVKRAALESLINEGNNPDAYVVKVRGSEVHDESQSLSAIGVRAGTTVFVHARRRRVIR